jgi:hypothetical protein
LRAASPEGARLRSSFSRVGKRCHGANLVRPCSLNFYSLQAAPLARSDSNSGHRHIQTLGQKAPQSFVRAPLDGRSIQPNAQSALPFANDLIAVGSRLHANEKTQPALAFAHLNQ